MYKLYNKNCADMSEIEDEYIQMILTSPNPIHDFDAIIPVLHECYRVLKNDGIFFFNVGHPMSSDEQPIPFGFMASYPFYCMRLIERETVFRLATDIIIVKKYNGFNIECYIPEYDRLLFPIHEHLLMFVKSDTYIFDKTFVKHGKYLLNDVWQSSKESLNWDEVLNDSERSYNLPRPFDKKIVEYCIRLTTKEGDMVLDPYAGTGTLGVVAEALGRNSIMYEIEDYLCEIVHRRIKIGL